MLALWSSLAEKNAFPPPSKATGDLKPAHADRLDAIYRVLIDRFTPDLPGPLPQELLDLPSARSAGGVVAAALQRLDRDVPLKDAIAAVPAPRTPAQHVTQAAILWHAVPIARRLRSEAFQALNREQASFESKEAAGELLDSFLADRPLLSLREDSEEFFTHAAPPILDGLRECLGLRRWLVQRLAAPSVAVHRQVATLARIAEIWPDWASDFRDALTLRNDVPTAEWLEAFVPFLQNWPDDLAPALRMRTLALKQTLPKENYDGPEPVA